MTRAVLAYLVLVLLPAAGLGYFAFRVADEEHARRLAEARSELEREAGRLASRFEESLERASERAIADESVPAGHARDGRWLGFAPQAGEPSAEELRWFELSIRGGESFEHELGDPARALDAYAFYLPRVRTEPLRSRLQLGAARSAHKCGQRLLAEAALRELSQAPAAWASEEGVPIALAASELLGEPAPALWARVKAQAELERLVLSHPEVLESADAVLDGGQLLFARTVGSGAAAIREIRAVPVAGIDEDPAPLAVRLAPRAEAASPGEAEKLIRLGKDGPVAAALYARDPSLEAKTAAAGVQRSVFRGLVLLLVAVTLAGGAALALYLSRERRLQKLRSQLLANVSHELKTPVTSIRLFAEMLAEDGVDAAGARRYGQHIAAEGERLSQLVEGLLDLSRPGRNDATLPREPVDLRALLGRIAERFAFQAREHGIQLEAAGCGAGSGAGEILAATNAPAVERIVLNLLDNAQKYRQSEKPWVRLGLEARNGAARISVEDNGIGIPRRDLERVFEDFYRVRYDDYAVKGSGLGLSIARKLARKLGGDVTVESRPGEGSTFTLEIPLASEAADERQNPGR